MKRHLPDHQTHRMFILAYATPSKLLGVLGKIFFANSAVLRLGPDSTHKNKVYVFFRFLI